jgi:hypothetical protein
MSSSTTDSDTSFDLVSAHRQFSVECFNQTWDLIDRKQRTPEDEDEMLRLAFASAFHWSRRPDCNATHRSISFWQLSRVLALVGDATLAERYAKSCLAVSVENEVPAFFLGYAYEALARAAALVGKQDEVQRCIALARDLAEKVAQPGERKLLLDDLAALG